MCSETMPVRAIVAGATGWLGSAIAERVHGASGLELVAAVGRSRAGYEFPAGAPGAIRLAGATEAALAVPADVFLDATQPAAAVVHAKAALERGLAVIVTATDQRLRGEYERLGALALERGCAVAVIPNLARTLAALEMCARALGRHFPQAVLTDHAQAGVREPLNTTLAIADILRAEGAGVTVSSVRSQTPVSQLRLRMPMPHEELEIRHTATAVLAYADGAVAAIERIPGRRGLLNGLSWIFEPTSGTPPGSRREAPVGPPP
jgi:4-hydroxy-tetrahydrodipicolinate reductase